MICRNCSIYPFCKKTTKASDSCNEGIKRKLENEVKKYANSKRFISS